jgi:hypothetical protein
MFAGGSVQVAPTATTYTFAWNGITNAWTQACVAFAWDGSVAPAATYWISPTGNDSNAGTMSSPWLTRQHSTNCQDVIDALAGTYAEANFRVNTDGPVACPVTNVRMLHCVVFDDCILTISNAGAYDSMSVSSSYSGVDGWDITVTAPSTNGCIEAYPPSTSVQVHHVLIANNVCHGAGDGCFFTGWNSVTGVDYLAIVGNIAYNCAQDTANCYSAFDAVPLANYDTLPGTHFYLAFNYAWGTVDPSACNGTGPTDGQAYSLDSLQESSYTGQSAVVNNIGVYNGGTCVQNFYSFGSPTFIAHNTCGFNHTGAINANPCPEINFNESYLNWAYLNLVETGSTGNSFCTVPGPMNVAEYALGSSYDNNSNLFSNNFIYSAVGNNTAVGSARLAYNTTGTNPNFFNPVLPPAPNCTGFVSVPACAATIIADFTPTNINALSYGYQPIRPGNTYDPLFPQWLCNVTNLPPNIITMGCGKPPTIEAKNAGSQ